MIYRLVLFFLLFTSISFGEEVATIRVLAINSTGTDLYYLAPDGNYQSLEITPYRIGHYRKFRLDDGRSVSVFRKAMIEGKEVYKVVASAPIRGGGSQCTAFLRTSSNQWSMALIDDVFDMKEDCQLRLVNALPVTIMLKIGDDVVEVEPGKSDLIPVAHKGRRPVVGLIAVYKRAGGEWEQFFNSPKVILPNSRMTAVALVRENETNTTLEANSSSVGVELFTFSDRLPEAL